MVSKLIIKVSHLKYPNVPGFPTEQTSMGWNGESSLATDGILSGDLDLYVYKQQYIKIPNIISFIIETIVLQIINRKLSDPRTKI